MTFMGVTMPSCAMARLGELDLPDRLAPTVPRWATQLGVALLCAAGIEIGRTAVNAIAPGSAVFALVFPAIMMATLFARWRVGVDDRDAISICLHLLHRLSAERGDAHGGQPAPRGVRRGGRGVADDHPGRDVPPRGAPRDRRARPRDRRPRLDAQRVRASREEQFHDRRGDARHPAAARQRSGGRRGAGRGDDARRQHRAGAPPSLSRRAGQRGQHQGLSRGSVRGACPTPCCCVAG